MKILHSVAKYCIGILLIVGTVLSPLPVYALTHNEVADGNGTGSFTYTGAADYTALNDDNADTSYATLLSGGAGIMDNVWPFADWAGVYLQVNSVTLYVKARNAVGGSAYGYVEVLSGGVTDRGTGTGISSVYTTYSKTWTFDPGTGSSWTQAGINAAKFGCAVHPSYNEFRVTYLYIVIDYTAPTVPLVTTVAANPIAPTSATLNGYIDATGGATITDYGFGWSTGSKADPGNTAPTASAYAAVGSWEIGAGSYSIGVITHSTGATLTANTPYFFRAAAKNSVGWSWGSELSFKTIGIPVGTTQTATNVMSTMARMNANVNDQNGQLCDVQFGYDVHTHATVAAYANVTAWVNDVYATGSNPYVDILAGLAVSTPYFFRVAIRNDAGTLEGSELTFTTTSGVNQPASMTAIPSSTVINLSWVKSSANNTWIRYAEGAFPAATNAGTFAYSGVGSSYELTGLTPGKSYYFSAWGLTGGVYSAAYTTVLSTTSAYTLPTGLPTTTNTTPVTVTPSSIKLSSTPIIGATITTFSTSYNIGEMYIWYFVWFIFGACLFVILYNVTHQNDIISGLVTAGWFGLGTAQELVGLVAMVIILIVWASTSIVGRNRV
jgi:hypothetical protein